jgi:hypothetical protein
MFEVLPSPSGSAEGEGRCRRQRGEDALLSSRVQMDLVSTYVKPKTLITLKPGDGVWMKIGKVKV